MKLKQALALALATFVIGVAVGITIDPKKMKITPKLASK